MPSSTDKSPSLQLFFPEPDIAELRWDMPARRVNLLTPETLDELDRHLDALSARSGLAGIIITSGKPAHFSAGADIRQWEQTSHLTESELVERSLHGKTVISRLSQFSPVTVAAVHGVCLGAAAELACWCDRRIATNAPETRIGWPEIRLGMLPGWGGTVRLPRLIGLGNTLQLILEGTLVDAADAARLGLVDEVVTEDRLLAAAIAQVRCDTSDGEYRRDRQRWSSAVAMPSAERKFLLETARRQIQDQAKSRYPAPAALLDLLAASAPCASDQACHLESECFARLRRLPETAAMISVELQRQRNRRDPGVDADVEPGVVQAVGVIGAGIMGIGIAAVNVARDLPVLLYDAAPAALERGMAAIASQVDDLAAETGGEPDNSARPARFVHPAGSLDDLADCDLVVESVVETIEVKRSIFAQLEPLVAQDAIIASNTSTIRIVQLAQELRYPERFCGMHFFNPVRNRELVEIVRGSQTSDRTLATVVAYAKRLGKLPVVVNDGPGFLVNRLLLPYMNEALDLLCQGATIQQIDQAAESFGMPLGPMALYDLIGIDTAFYGGRTLWEAFSERVVLTPVLPAMFKAGRLGEKCGRGFYFHEQGQRLAPDPDVQRLVEPYVRQRIDFDRETIIERLFLPMLLEATRVLADGIVRDVREVDLGMVYGLAFPSFRGGLLYWADSIGAARLVEMTKPYQRLGKRFEPTEILLEMAKENRRFYPAE